MSRNPASVLRELIEVDGVKLTPEASAALAEWEAYLDAKAGEIHLDPGLLSYERDVLEAWRSGPGRALSEAWDSDRYRKVYRSGGFTHRAADVQAQSRRERDMSIPTDLPRTYRERPTWARCLGCRGSGKKARSIWTLWRRPDCPRCGGVGYIKLL